MPKLPDKTAFKEITSITIEGICEDGVKRKLMFFDFANPIVKTYDINLNLDCKGYKVALIDITNDEKD